LEDSLMEGEDDEADATVAEDETGLVAAVD